MSSHLPRPRRLGHGTLSLALVASASALLWSAPTQVVWADPSGPAPTCTDTTCTVRYTAGAPVQTFDVPTGVTTVTATVAGAQAGDSTTDGGAAGGQSVGTFSVAAGDQLRLVVGTRGGDVGGTSAPTGGYGGGGAGGAGRGVSQPTAGGGGGSYLFDDDQALVLAAGGGGSAGARSGTTGPGVQASGGGGGSATTGAGVGTNGSSLLPDGPVGGTGATSVLSGVGGGGRVPVGGDVLGLRGSDGTGTVEGPDVLALGGRGGTALLPGGSGGGGYHGGGGGGGSDVVLPGVLGAGGGGGAGFAADAVRDVTGSTGTHPGAGEIVLSYLLGDPDLHFSSERPARPTVAGQYTLSAESSAQGVPITFSIDAATTDQACSLSGTTVSFDHVGRCVVAAEQQATRGYRADRVTEELSIERAAQVITFAGLPGPAVVGTDLALEATGGGSGQPVTFTVDAAAADVCRTSGGRLSYLRAGTCAVVASQAGNADFTAAVSIRQQTTVSRVATDTELTLSPTAPVVGQPVAATATVGGATSGSVQFSVDGQAVGAPVALDASGTATLASLGAAGASLGVGGHPVRAVFTPSDQVTYTSSDDDATLTVDQAQSSTRLTVRPDHVTAAVGVVAPGSGQPTGTVSFFVDGHSVGDAPVVSGTATLAVSVPSARDAEVSAFYAGSDSYAASADTTVRHNPTIVASVTSSAPRSASGWYRSPVVVSFTCTATDAALSTPCPAPTTLSADGASLSVTGTVSSSDGGMATVTVTGIRIDRSAPKVAVSRVKDGARFFAAAPQAGCVARDDVSGIASCKASRTVKGSTVTYTATATDVAGNAKTVKAHASTYAYGMTGAPYTKGTYQLQRGHGYTLVAKSGKRAQLVKPRLAPKKPKTKSTKFVKTSKGRWALGYTPAKSLKTGKTYNLGIKTGKKVHVIKIRVVS